MRFYIFTERERAIIQKFLARKIPLTDRGLSQIRTRLKASTLQRDLELVVKLREAIPARAT